MGTRHFVTLPIVQTLLLVTFDYSLSSEAVVVMRQLRRGKRLWRMSLTRSHKRTSMGPSRSCWNGTTSALQPEETTSKGTKFSCVYYQKGAINMALIVAVEGPRGRPGELTITPRTQTLDGGEKKVLGKYESWTCFVACRKKVVCETNPVP